MRPRSMILALAAAAAMIGSGVGAVRFHPKRTRNYGMRHRRRKFKGYQRAARRR